MEYLEISLSGSKTSYRNVNKVVLNGSNSKWTDVTSGIPQAGFSKRIEVGVSIYKVRGDLSAADASGGEPESGVSHSLVGGGYRGPPAENFEILDCRRCILRPF